MVEHEILVKEYYEDQKDRLSKIKGQFWGN